MLCVFPLRYPLALSFGELEGCGPSTKDGEGRVLPNLSFCLGACYFGEVLRDTDTVKGLGKNVYPLLEQTQNEGLLPF